MHRKTTGEDLPSTGAVARFILVAYGLGFAAQLAAIRAGLSHGGGGWLLLTMWAPAVAAVTTSAAARRRAWAAVRRPGWRWLAPAFLLGALPALLRAGMLAVTGAGAWDAEHFELAPDGGSIAAIHHLGVVLGGGHQPFALFALNLALSVALGSVASALLGGVGEELGWRAVLQPALEGRWGSWKGTIAVGLIWAYWHLPVNLLGYNDAVHPVLNALVLFPLAVVAMSFVLAWLTRRSGSVWPAALAHGANNTLGAAFLLKPGGWSAESATEILAAVAVAAWFIWRAARPPRPPVALTARMVG